MTEPATKEALKLEKQSIDIEVRRVDLALKQAELGRKAAELKKAEAEARSADLSMQRAELLTAEAKRTDEARELTKSQSRVFAFDDVVTDATAEMFSDWLKNRSLRFPDEDLTVYLNSPGGSIFAGFVAMDAIREAETAGNKVTAKVTGMAASMAGVIAQAASTRLIGVNSELMIHTASSFQLGHYSTFEIEDQSEFLKRLTKKLVKVYTARSAQWAEREDELFTRIHEGRKDWWLTAEEAVAEGFMDSVF